ncbi:receptor activity-modifying protein 3 [Brachyhypopomus gauderio]|uniref:receptor activity-modifying protein 3 n=1 Tax=Brachyhypopomus gauderio TaxID=698409 RepID=UPI0040436DD2
MDVNTSKLLKVFIAGILVINLMMSKLLATENGELPLTPRAPVLEFNETILECNETLLHLEIEKCGEHFKINMVEVDPQNLCNLTHFIGEYHYFSACTENNAVRIGCFWPNPVVEHYIIHIHKQFFSNCTLKSVVYLDPSEDTLAILILIPVLLTVAMVALVVWCSKRSDILA